jgi:adenylosuccinate synthase
MRCDIVVGSSWGDESKIKVVNELLKKNAYTHCIRYAGGQNAGGAFYHNDKKFISNIVPIGVFYGIKSVIASGCFLNPESFFKEVENLEQNGINTKGLLKISNKAGIITQKHIDEDSKDQIVGTTKRGIGPAAADKALRCGILAKDVSELKDYLVDFYDEVVNNNDNYVLFAGSQGTFLDVNIGMYPYVTSTLTTVAGVFANGVPFSSVNRVILASKSYDTYLGGMKLQPEGDIYNVVADVGGEVGNVTGRRRQVNHLNISNLKKAVKINDANEIIISKMDVLQEVFKTYSNAWSLIEDNKVINLNSEDNFKKYIRDSFNPNIEIKWSYSPYEI